MAKVIEDVVDYSIVEQPLESVNGDAAFICSEQDQLFIAIFDGAGHGVEANSIALRATEFLDKHKDMELTVLLNNLHEELRGSRGGVAIVGKLDINTLEFRYVGIGNIFLKKFGNQYKQEITQEGVIGYNIRTPMEKSLKLVRGDILVLYTDGIASQFNTQDYPGILSETAGTIAKNLINKFGKNNDDATCVVIRLL